ncbi:class I SAM-dependent methyltransferase [Bradyrhizobium sp.]|uniref:class I SAM-dependent methyltransferase n=1 Tax=Bradyrhizobium sp. TaxID=376 RepID=UPI001DA545B5|nr:class I SAM-dependent methyltransferase [Bradyrhizobium sp.]MBI5320787.1 class I SAM-dependent methyltransferase [Bradyrhizobium sp.]
MVVSKEAVKEFWERNPLFKGEVDLDPMSREFFERHEHTYRNDVLAGGFSDVFFPFPEGASVLDVGCGPGIWTRELARRGYRTSAVDLTENAVVLTRHSLSMFGLTAEVQTGDAENLPFPNETFDGVVSHGVIHHTPNTERCIAEMARVLKSGGLAVVSVYYKNSILRSRALTRLAALVLGGWVSLPGRGRANMLASGDPDEIVRLYDGSGNPLGKSYTADQFEAMFRNVGLNVRGSFRYYFPRRAFGPVAGLLAPFKRMLARRFGLMYTAIAHKEARR